MGVGGGAWYPPAQASVADRISTRRSYLVPFSGYVAMTIYALGMVIDQAIKDGFRIRNIDEKNLIQRPASIEASGGSITGEEKATDEKRSEEGAS